MAQVLLPGRQLTIDAPRLALVPRAHEPSAYERVVKRAFDVAVALAVLVVALPVILAVALAIRVKLGPGVLFLQRRVGRGGVPFTVYKFRTMRNDRRRATAIAYDGPDRRLAHKRDDDPRHTPLGRMLRKLSLDELPQLVNVLKGEMSIVGPRPELASVVAQYEDWQHARHRVKPGLTGLWQVTARGNGALMKDFVALDLEYVERISLRTDAAIVARTVPVLLFGRTGS